MKSMFPHARRTTRQRFAFLLTFSLTAAFIFLPLFKSAAHPAQGVAKSGLTAAAGETCLAATVINPASLPFAEDSTTVAAANDIDPTLSGCAPGAGADVVYSFTPSVTDLYTIGATPTTFDFDLSLYIVTDCANPGGSCIGGANQRLIGKGESLALTLNAGTTYFIVVDGVQFAGSGPFHFSLRRKSPANDQCSAPALIESSRLPFSASATTFGATNDLNPGMPCLRSNLSGTGPEIVYQFTPSDSQNYDVTVTPFGNFDPSVYIVTDCATVGGCVGSDFTGDGQAEVLRRNLTAGTTYFIVVDGSEGDAGDFTLSLVPTIPIAPVAPTELVAKAVSQSQIDLTWKDNSSNELGFRIERSFDGINFAEVATVGSNVTSFSDTGLTPSTAYFYRVLAFNNFGTSDPSNVAGDTTQAPPVPQFPVLNVSPLSLDFGSVSATQTATRTVTIKNDGGVDLIITSISDPPAPYSILNKPQLPLTIQPGQSVNLTVQFAPVSVSRFNGAFVINSNAPLNPTATVTLDGTATGSPVPNLEVSPALIDFTGGASVTQIQVRNTGNADLFISSFRLPTGPFFLANVPALPLTLKPGEGFVMTLSFSPAAPGVYLSSLTILNNDPDQVFQVIQIRGTSTPQSELLKLRAPTQFTAVLGQANTLNVIATNGTNSDIRLTAGSIPGGTFTDRGNGRGDLVFTPSGTTRSTAQVMFTATDSANRTKSLVANITIVPASETFRVRVSWTAPQTASNPPTGVLAVNQSFQQLSLTSDVFEAAAFEPADAAGLIGYAVYRSATAGAQPSLANIVGVVPATATSFTDLIPTPGGTSFVMPPAYYVVTALYSTGTESTASNETSTEPRLEGLQFKGKRLRFLAANSNVEVGATLVVDGTQVFTLERDGDFIVAAKNARSTPGNLRPRDIFTSGSTHQIQVRNPHGPNSRVITFSRQ